MIIGSYEMCIKTRILEKIFTKMCGIMDFHSHVRLKPLIKYFKREHIYGNFLEIGCGVGLVAFEINRRGHVINYIGIDMDSDNIRCATLIRDALQLTNIDFVQEDAFEFLDSRDLKDKVGDYVILYDFIEHIPTPEKFITDLSKSLGEDWKGTFIVSVPTPKYPKVFGKEFHESIGHLVDGYSKYELDKLFAAINYKNTYFEYNTGLIGNIGAYIYYHAVGKVNLKFLYFLTLPFRMGVDVNSSRVSSSLFAVYSRV